MHTSESETNLLFRPWYAIAPVVVSKTSPPQAYRKNIQSLSEKSFTSPVSLTRENLTVVTPSMKDADVSSTFCIASRGGGVVCSVTNANLQIENIRYKNVYLTYL